MFVYRVSEIFSDNNKSCTVGQRASVKIKCAEEIGLYFNFLVIVNDKIMYHGNILHIIKRFGSISIHLK